MKQEDKIIKLVLTGGHAATAALATVEQIVIKHSKWKLFWIGPASAMEGRAVTTAAEKTLVKDGVRILKIVAGKFKKDGSFIERLWAYAKIPIGFAHALFLVAKISPDIVISFGGFASFPVVFIAWLFGKKIVIHEQITGAGLANKLSAPFADKIAVARSESLALFPRRKTVRIGNPQISKIFKVKPKTKIGSPPTIYITGGSSGAETINTAVDSVLERLLEDYSVIHQVGEINLPYFDKRRLGLKADLRARYECFGYVPPEKVVKCFERADIVVSRAGANTVSDIVATKRPAILIPIPWSIGDEQRKNAKKAEKTGIAIILEQQDLTGEVLLQKISYLVSDWKHIVESRIDSDFDLDVSASKSMLSIIETCLADGKL